MSRFERLAVKMKTAEVIADDAIDHLVKDLSQYDRIYSKWSKRKAGRDARTMSIYPPVWSELETFERLDNEEPSLFPEIQTDELHLVIKGFASHIGRRYARELFTYTTQKHRQFSKMVFPVKDDGVTCADVYIDNTWSSIYADEFVEAHTLGLHKQTAEEIDSQITTSFQLHRFGTEAIQQ
jgi:hypothetical protein